MKLITFDSETLPVVRKGEATIRFNRVSASCLSKAAAERTGYGGGDLIAIHQHEDNPEDWYISLSEVGFKLRDDGKGGALHFNNSSLANMALDYFEIKEESAAFLIGSEPVIVDDVYYWPIITGKPIVNKRKKKKDA